MEKKAKIIATLGPAIHNENKLKSIVKSGVDAFRVNFSRNTAGAQKIVKRIRKIEKILNKPLSVIADLQGVKLRVGKITNDEVKIKFNQKFTFDTNKKPGDESRVCFPYPGILKKLKPGNKILIDFALKALDKESLGTDNDTDFLHIGFSSTDHIGHRFGSNSKEVQDTYIRLDKDIENLLNILDKKIGENNYLVYLSADHAITHSPDFLADNKIPFNKIASSKVFAPELGQFINNISNYNVFLNHEKIHEMDEDVEEIKNKIKTVLLNEPWIYDVYDFGDLEEVVANNENYSLNMLLNNSHPKYRGDLAFFVNPFWVRRSSSTSNHGTPTTYETQDPIIFYGKGIKPGSSYERHNVKDIAPTLAAILGINFPILTTGNVLSDAIK